MQVVQRIAAEVLANYSTFASRDDTWQTMELWQHTLQQIQNSEQEGFEVHTLLEHCLYAFLIIQAHAKTSGEPMLLLTPDLFRSLQPLQHLLPKCQFLQTARSVFRLYWMAVHNAKYGGQERAFEEVWKILPWIGASACLSGTESPRSSSKIHTFLRVLSSTLKEQLCTNTSDTLGWKRKPPPYVDHLDITVNFSNNHVAPASIVHRCLSLCLT